MSDTDWRTESPTASEVEKHALRRSSGNMPINPDATDNWTTSPKAAIGAWLVRVYDKYSESRSFREMFGWHEPAFTLHVVYLSQYNGEVFWMTPGQATRLEGCRWLKVKTAWRPIDPDGTPELWPVD